MNNSEMNLKKVNPVTLGTKHLCQNAGYST